MNFNFNRYLLASNHWQIALLASSVAKPANWPASAVSFPWLSSGEITGRLYFFATIKSSAPWPGAVCTQPVPASSVTCSPLITKDSRSRNGCWQTILSSSAPFHWPNTCGASSMPQSAIKLFSISFATTYFSSPNCSSWYSYSGWMEIATLPGSVHGVVVQITT